MGSEQYDIISDSLYIFTGAKVVANVIVTKLVVGLSWYK